MAEEVSKRKLTAILSADVVGYSRLMEDNEEATIQTLNTYRNSMTTLVQQHRGRVVDTTGDNLMAEFSSVVDAVKCAVETQKELSERNATLPEKRRMLFRIGVNLGDIVEEEDRIYGDGVNIAARVESLADAGGICISGTAYDQIGKKLSLGYEYLGEQTVKNIEKPVRVYRVLMEPEAAGKVIGEKRKEKRRIILAAVIVLLIGLGGLAGWYLYIEQTKQVEPASTEKMAYPLPDKPSIAVLPFDNLSEDPKQEYFSDGLTEEIITALSKIDNMFVIARNSTFTYKGKPVKVKQVAEDLGVHYVLEGSVRKAENRLRITAQLIDALKGHHLWAERYDRDLKDIFVIQDDITKKVITALNVKLRGKLHYSVYEKGTDSLEAYLKLLQMVAHSHDIKESNVFRKQLAEEAIALDPNYAWAYDALGWNHLNDIYYGLTKDFSKSWKTAFELGQKAQALDERAGHDLLGSLYQLKGQHEKAVAEAERHVELFPNSSWAQSNMGRYLMNADKPQEAIPFYKKGLRLDPYAKAPYYYNFGGAYWMLGQYEGAISICKKGLKRHPDDMFIHMVLAVSFIETGNVEEARKSAEEVLRINPKITLSWLAKMLPWKNKDQVARWIGDLRKAGLK
jgi:TolB-like protein/class 3 adenylate cyclase